MGYIFSERGLIFPEVCRWFFLLGALWAVLFSSDIVYELCWTTVLDTKNSFSVFINSSRALMKCNISYTVLFSYCVGSWVHMGNIIFRILLHTSLPWSLHPAFLAMQCINHCLKLHSMITPFSRSLLFQHQCVNWNNTFFAAAALPGMEWAPWLWWKPFFAIFKFHCFIYFTYQLQFPLSPLFVFPHLRTKLLHSLKVGPGIPEWEMGSKKVAWQVLNPQLVASQIDNAILWRKILPRLIFYWF